MPIVNSRPDTNFSINNSRPYFAASPMADSSSFSFFTMTTPTVEPWRGALTTIGNGIVGRCPSVDHFPWRRRYLVFQKFFFRRILSKAISLAFDAVAGISDAAAFQNFLKLAIFAKSSVDRIEREIDIVRQLEILVPHIDFHHFGA